MPRRAAQTAPRRAPTRIVALDISSAATGVAVGDGSVPPATSVYHPPRGHRGSTLAAFRSWAVGYFDVADPELIAIEAPILAKTNNHTPSSRYMMIALSSIIEAVAAERGTPFEMIAIQTWRKAFLGNGNPRDAKAEALRMCELLGWPTGGVHDRAEAAGVWASAHLQWGYQRGLQQSLSVGAVRQFVRS